MDIIIRPRSAGKTTELIKHSAKTGAYIVVKDHFMARYTVELAKKMGLEIPFPLTYVEFLDRRYAGKRINGFLIDDAESLLQSLTPVTIKAIAMSNGEET